MMNTSAIPRKPVPYMGEIVTGMDADYMIADQRFAARRPDVLVYQTEELAEDVTIAGPIEVDLVSTSGTDSDWIVKLIDVYPDDFPDPKTNPKEIRMGGYQQLVRGDVMRGKFRNSFEKPNPLNRANRRESGLLCPIPTTVFARATGSWCKCKARGSHSSTATRKPFATSSKQRSDYQSATQRVFRSPDAASRLNVLVSPETEVSGTASSRRFCERNRRLSPCRSFFTVPRSGRLRRAASGGFQTG